MLFVINAWSLGCMLTAQEKNGNVIVTCVFVTEKVLLKVVKRKRSFSSSSCLNFLNHLIFSQLLGFLPGTPNCTSASSQPGTDHFVNGCARAIFSFFLFLLSLWPTMFNSNSHLKSYSHNLPHGINRFCLVSS